MHRSTGTDETIHRCLLAGPVIEGLCPMQRLERHLKYIGASRHKSSNAYTVSLHMLFQQR